MTRSTTARLLRIGLVLTLFMSAAGASLAAPAAPSGAGLAHFQEGDTHRTPPGFGTLPDDVLLIALASGALDSLTGPVTLLVERFLVDPQSELGAAEDPQIVQVEYGTLTYEDDLGLEAEVAAGEAQYFAPGDGETLANLGDEPAIVVRTSLVGASLSITAGPDDSEDAGNGDGDGGASEDDGGGEETETRDRDGTTAPALAGVNALIALTPTAAPDEVIISLTDTGFEPAEIAIARSGDLIIENATDAACRFEIPELEIAADIGPGDIETIAIVGPVGTYLFLCLDDDDAVIGAGELTIGRPDDEGAPPAIATPPAVIDDEPTSDLPAVSDEPTGVLLEVRLALEPGGATEFFSAWIVLQPGAALSLVGTDGALGVVTTGGDLTVARPGRTPARLRDGLSVVLPPGTAAELTNAGDDAITLYLAGLTGSQLAPADEPGPGDEPDIDEPDIDDPIDELPDDDSTAPGGAYAFFPSDAEMATYGLFPRRNAFTEITDPFSNDFWFDDGEEAEDLLFDFDWLNTIYVVYDSQGEEASHGTVDVFILIVDAFEDEEGAAAYYTHIERDEIGMQGRTSRAVRNLDGVDNVIYGTYSDPDSDDEFAIMVIHSGAYVLTLYALGPDLDATNLVIDVASLIFGPRG